MQDIAAIVRAAEQNNPAKSLIPDNRRLLCGDRRVLNPVRPFRESLGVMKESVIDDRRVRRTRLAIFEAFKTLVLSRRYDEIRVADIIEEADVGRSTFYDHFTGKDDVLLSSIEVLFDVLADTVTQRVARERVFFVLSHFWDQRALSRMIFGHDLFFKLARKLAGMMEERLIADGATPEAARIHATEAAMAQLGLIKSWSAGDLSCDVDALADHFVTQWRDRASRS